MRKGETLLFVIIIFFFCLFFFGEVSSVNYYINATTGNDTNSGLSPSLAWKTISKINNQNFLPGDNIYFERGGIWNSTLIINSSGNSTHQITFGSYGEGNRPIITGFTNISSWSDLGGGVYEVNCTSCINNLNLVIINNTPQALGRYPNINESNGGYLTFESHSGNTSITDNELTGAINWTGAEIVVRAKRWILDKSLITNHATNTLTFIGISYAPDNNFGYFIQKDERTLDIFGEWYFNFTSKSLKIYFGEENPSSYSIKASFLKDIVLLNGSNYITLDNISLEGGNFSLISIDNAENVNIQNCNLSFSGREGIWARNSSYLIIENNSIENCLNKGVYLYYNYMDASPHSTIKNNTVINTGLLAGMGESEDIQYTAIMTWGSDNCTIESNFINNSGYDGIHFSGYSNLIQNNSVNNFCKVIDDGGGIYVSGATHSAIGSIIRYNTVLEGIGNGDGTDNPSSLAVQGIYLDQNSDNIEVYNNTAANCSDSGFYMNTGANNNFVHDNLFLDNLVDQIYLTYSDNNLIYNNTIRGVSGRGIYLHDAINNTITDNLIESDLKEGILISTWSNNNTLINNYVKSNLSDGIYLYESSNNLLKNNTAISTDFSGIYISTSSINNTLINNFGYSNLSSGILFVFSDFNILINNTCISESNYGINIYGSSNNVLFNHTAIGSLSGSRGVHIDYSNNTLFRDCVNISGISYDVYISSNNFSINNTFVNCSYNTNKETIGGSNELIRKWYFDGNVTYSNGTAIPNTNLTIYNSSNISVYSVLTDSNGDISRQELIDYINTGGTKSFNTPHIVNVTKVGYTSNSTIYNLTAMNNLFENFILEEETGDIIPPYFTTIPVNTSLFYGNESLRVQFTAIDETEFDSYSINDTRFLINQSGFLLNTTPMAVGNYNINITINDTSNNLNWTIYNVQINQSREDCGVYFNATSPITYPENFIVYTNCTSTYILYKNGTSISNGSFINGGAGAYNISVQRTDIINYTNSFDQQQFIINKNTEGCQVLFNESSPLEYPKSFLVWANCTSTFTLAINGTTITNYSEQALDIGSYNFSILREDNSNYTSIYNESEFRIVDITSPNYSQNSTNNTLAGLLTLFSINVDDNLELNPNGTYIFSTNNTGEWVNDSAINFNSTPSWANITKILNSTVGLKIGYMWYFNDSFGNTNLTPIYELITEDTPAVPPPSSSSSGGSTTPSFWTNTAIINNTLFEEGYSKKYSPKERIRFKVGLEYHYVGLISLNSVTAIVNVSSIPQQKIFVIGESSKFEVNNDSYYDVLVTLNSIENNKANLTVLNLHEEILPSQINNSQNEEQIQEEDSEPVLTSKINTGAEIIQKENVFKNFKEFIIEKQKNLIYLGVVILGLIILIVIILVINRIYKFRKYYLDKESTSDKSKIFELLKRYEDAKSSGNKKDCLDIYKEIEKVYERLPENYKKVVYKRINKD